MSKINYKARCVVSHKAGLFSEGGEYEVIDEGDACTGGWLSVIDNTGESRSVVWKGGLWTFERVDAPQPPTIEQLLAKANRHAAKAAKHERKRAELVERAKGMVPEGYELHESEGGGAGFKLAMSALEEISCELGLDDEPAEDMTDPANWKAGDVVEFCGSEIGMTNGEYYILTRDPHGSACALVTTADDNGEITESLSFNFRWISRPQGESA